MVKKRLLFVAGALIVMGSGSTAYAADQQHFWNIGQIHNDGWYDGFWCKLNLPYLFSNWSNDSTHNNNKINVEFWYNIDGGTGDWVEMGYHDGYAYSSPTQIDTTRSYNGLFTAIKRNGVLSISTFPQKYWAANSTHTMGASLTASNSSTDMRADGSVVLTYSGTTLGTHPSGYYEEQDYIDVGYEWGTLYPGSAGYSTTSPDGYPIQITDLNVHNSIGWHLWSEQTQFDQVKCKNTLYTAPYKPSFYDRDYNRLLFQ